MTTAMSIFLSIHWIICYKICL